MKRGNFHILLTFLLLGWTLPNAKANILFSQVGSTGSDTSSAHLVSTIDLQKFINLYNKLHGEAVGFYSLSSSPYNMTLGTKTDEHRQLLFLKRSLNRLKAISSTFNVNEPVNLTEFSSSEQEYKQITDQLTVNVSGRNRRGALGENIAKGVMKIIGFGFHKLNQKLVNEIYKSSEEKKNQLMIQNFPTASMSLTKSLDYLKQVVKDLKTKLTLDKDTVAKSKLIEYSKENFKYQVTLLTRLINNLTKVIAKLMQQNLPIGLFDPDTLQSTYGKLLQRIRKQGYHPVNPDYNIVFQSPTYTFMAKDEPNKLIIITFIPILKGAPMNLYHHIQSPLYINNKLSAKISDPNYEFISIDDTGTLIKQYTASDIQSCTCIQSIYHCPNNQIVDKYKEDSCLYNLFNSNLKRVLKTCNVEFSQAKDNAVQISGNTFQLLTTQKTQLVTQCKPKQISTIHGMHILNLTEECPQAYTSKFMFHYNPKHVSYTPILNIPTSTNMTAWFDSNVDLLTIQDLVIRNTEPLSYTKLKEQLSTYNLDQFLIIKQHVQDVFLTILLLMTIFYIGTCGKIIIDIGIIKCRRRFNQEQPDDPNDRENNKSRGTPIFIPLTLQHRLNNMAIRESAPIEPA